MKPFITYETLRQFTYSNDHLINGTIRGIILNFLGLGNGAMIKADTGDAKEYAKEGILFLTPYYNPWSWMNQNTVSLVDEILDVLFDHYHLPSDLPIVSSGASMGGLASLVYCCYAARTPAACVANCPVCDLPYHLHEREDLPRTLYSAFHGYEESMEDALRAHSPLHLIPLMPKIPYTIFHCCNDMSVNKEIHSDRFVTAMSEHHVAYIPVPLRGHCDLSACARLEYRQALLSPFGL